MHVSKQSMVLSIAASILSPRADVGPSPAARATTIARQQRTRNTAGHFSFNLNSVAGTHTLKGERSHGVILEDG